MIPMNRNLSALTRSEIRVYTNLGRATPGCIMLTLGEPDFDTPAPIKAAAVQALAENRTHYAPNQGTAELRRAIAAYETRRGNFTDPAQVLVTIGACQALFTAILGILNPGEEVILPTPAFGLYETAVTVAGGVPVRLDTAASGFQITPEALASVLSPKTKAIILNSPCNPTGTVLSCRSLAAVREAVAGKPIFVLCDNVYDSLVYREDFPNPAADPSLAGQRILCQSFSKPYAMTGWRVGYLCCPEWVMDRLLLLSAAEITAVPTFVQAAAVAALAVDPAPMREIYRRRRDFTCRRLREMGLRFPEPEGAFYVFPSIREFGLDSGEFCTRMIRETGVAAVPGRCFGAEGYIRLSYCVSDEALAAGMDRMETFVAALRG